MMNKALPPIIVVGMHRSGTALVSKVLRSAGIFMGARRDPNEEAVFFLRFNEWLLQQAGGSWNHPQPLHQSLAHSGTRAMFANMLATAVDSPLAYYYLGASRYFRYRSLNNLDFPWGWKDPRNAFTLPAWLDIFPEAKIIYVLRHGVDVAHSLRQRSHIETEKSARRLSTRIARFGWLFGLTQFYGSKHPGRLMHQTLDEAFRLWDVYNRNIQSCLSALDVPMISIRYEDMLADPLEHFHRLAEFCCISPAQDTSARLLDMIDPSRAFAYRNNEELVAFARQKEETLAAHGYE